MALTAIKIRMDYERAKAAAQKLEDVADSLKRMMENEYPEIMGDIRTNWRGENADLFLGKGDEVKSKMSKVEKDLRETAETIRRMAKNTYDAEMKALEVAKTRVFGN